VQVLYTVQQQVVRTVTTVLQSVNGTAGSGTYSYHCAVKCWRYSSRWYVQLPLCCKVLRVQQQVVRTVTTVL